VILVEAFKCQNFLNYLEIFRSQFILKFIYSYYTGLTHPTVGGECLNGIHTVDLVLCKRARNLKNAVNYIVFVLILDWIMKTA